MKLNSFTPETFPKTKGTGNVSTPRVSFAKVGAITFNPAACELIGLQAGDTIIIAQDADSPQDWYISKNVAGYPLRAGHGKKGVMLNHSGIADKVREALGLDKKITHNFLIAGKPTAIKGDKNVYWCLLARPKV